MPEERVAIQPPSVECAKLSGKWPQVQPSAPSWRSRSGPKTPASTRASCDVASIDSTRLMRLMSTEITGRGSPASGSRLPEMLEPAPNGMTTASWSRAACTMPTTWPSAPGRTTTSGRRPRSPRRWRTRSVRLLPRPCTTRSWSRVDTCSAPTASARRALSSPGSCVAGTSRSENLIAAMPGRRTSSSSTRWMNGASSGFPSWLNATSSAPQPHHFIAGLTPSSYPRALSYIGSELGVVLGARLLEQRCERVHQLIEERRATLRGGGARHPDHAAARDRRHRIREHAAHGAVGLIPRTLRAYVVGRQLEQHRGLCLVRVEVRGVVGIARRDLGRDVEDRHEARPQVGELVAQLEDGALAWRSVRRVTVHDHELAKA